MGEGRTRLAVAILLASAALVIATPAQAKRVALVIGNSAYRHAPELENPRNDATDMATALKALGVEVVAGMDLDKQAMDRKIREFASTLSGAEAGIFYFAGHGLQVNGSNFLVPVDAELSTATALEFEMVRLDLVQRVMEEEAKTNVLFLDACRNNPLSRNLARAMGTRAAAIGRGLAPVESGVGTLISFSTQPGNVALDGTGRNSPFAAALVKHIATSSETLTDLLVAVRNDVIAATDRKQVPWEHSALTGRFYFKAPSSTSGSDLAPVPPTVPLYEAEKASNTEKTVATGAPMEVATSAPMESEDMGPILAPRGGRKRFSIGTGSSVEVTEGSIVVAVRDPDLQRSSTAIKVAGRSTRIGIGQEVDLSLYGKNKCRLSVLNVRAEAVDFLMKCQ